MTIPRLIIIIVLGLIHKCTIAQTKFGNRWVVGLYGYQIDFNTSIVLHDTLEFSPASLNEGGHSNICDSNGNLLLCSDGMHISNHTGAILEGGDTLASPFYYTFSANSSMYSQSSIFYRWRTKYITW